MTSYNIIASYLVNIEWLSLICMHLWQWNQVKVWLLQNAHHNVKLGNLQEIIFQIAKINFARVVV